MNPILHGGRNENPLLGEISFMEWKCILHEILQFEGHRIHQLDRRSDSAQFDPIQAKAAELSNYRGVGTVGDEGLQCHQYFRKGFAAPTILTEVAQFCVSTGFIQGSYVNSPNDIQGLL